jgi:DnaJ-class molecular chaperone
MKNVSSHQKGCNCKDCTEAFEEMMSKLRNVTRDKLCGQCQGTGSHYRQYNEFGFGLCSKCNGSGTNDGISR